MASQWKSTLLAILILGILQGIFSAENSKFPEMNKLERSFYQTEVQVTDLVQQTTAFATEYYDDTLQRGKVEVLALGEKRSVFYYNETNEILEVNSTFCQTWLTDESSYYYEPFFYGWLNKYPLRIGPTAPLWYAQDKIDKIDYKGQDRVRGILCDEFALPIITDRDNVTLYYFFAADNWGTPYELSGLRVPIRIEAFGTSSQYSEKPDQWVEVKIQTDFAYFRPSLSDWTAFQPPLGLGCMLRKPTLSIPDIPNVFQYSAEFYDIYKGQKQSDSDIEYLKVWYDSKHKLARLDRFSKLRYSFELYDFNTGVTYTNLKDTSCTIKPLKDSDFESYEGKLVGHLKNPDEVLNLQGTFYYMGQRQMRGVRCDVFESIQKDVEFRDTKLDRFVVTVYFTQEYLEVDVNGNDETKVPIYYLLTGWKANQMVLREQYNVFAFDNMVWPKMYNTFGLERCFPSSDDKSYFLMIIPTTEVVATAMEGQDELITLQIRNQIMKHADVSEMRIPFLRADYKASGVYVTGLILNRPPVLTQFWFEFEWDAVTHDPDLKQVDTAQDKEQCAYSCVQEGEFTCTGFFFCENGCWLKSKDVIDPDDSDKERVVGKKCKEYLRAERDSDNKEEYLGDALMKLEEAVLKNKIKISVEMDNPVKLTKVVNVTDIIIGEGPYTGDDMDEKPYAAVVNFAQLDTKDSTVTSLASVSTVNECYRNCKDSTSMACSSFSFCADAKGDKRCRITSTLVVGRTGNEKLITDDNTCYVYTIQYLNLFVAYPGRVLMLSGEDSLTGITSAEMCAQKCRLEDRFVCRGFEYCKNAKSCVLHSKHILDLKPGEIALDKTKLCTHYTAKYMADYLDMGHLLINDDSDKRVELTLEECARVCSEERGSECKSFNYCPPTEKYSADSSCSLSTKFMTGKEDTVVNDKCRHYDKRKNIDDYAKPDKKLSGQQTSGYTSKGFAGLVVGMLAFGLLVGVLCFVGYSYFKSRGGDSGMTIKFVKQET